MQLNKKLILTLIGRWNHWCRREPHSIFLFYDFFALEFKRISDVWPFKGKVGSIQLSEGWSFSKFGRFTINIHEPRIAYSCRVCSIGGGTGSIEQGDTSFQVIFQWSVATAIHPARQSPSIFTTGALFVRACCYKKGMDQDIRFVMSRVVCTAVAFIAGFSWTFHIGEIVCLDQSIQSVAKTYLATNMRTRQVATLLLRGPLLWIHNFSCSWCQMVMFLMEH